MDFLLAPGVLVRNGILYIASILKNDAAPGYVTILLVAALCITVVRWRKLVKRRLNALGSIHTIIAKTPENEFSQHVSSVDAKIAALNVTEEQQNVAEAWKEYRETHIVDDQDGTLVIRNAVRPGQFFNLDDLHFTQGFWRIVPGLFVTIGLSLTFLGLISALNSMSTSLDDGGSAALEGLLTIASAKFIMSLTGLCCSIVFTIGLRSGTSQLEKTVHSLNSLIEKRLTFISLEDLCIRQLKATIESREHFRKLGLEMVAEIGRPLREDLPRAISECISSAITPVIEQVSRLGNDGVGEMVQSLSSRFSEDVGRALSQASERISLAGDQIKLLAERMDQSSGKMGNEMESAIGRLGQAVETLREGMSQTAETATSAFNQGAENLLATMNSTLQGIKDNTSDGARAMGEAAADMKAAALGIRTELETAAKQGAEAAQVRMSESASQASDAIGLAATQIMSAFGNTAGEITKATETMTQKASSQLLSPLSNIAEKLEGVMGMLEETSTALRRASEGIKEGAIASENASGSFRSSAQSLTDAADPIRAMMERIEISTRQLRESSENSLSAIASAAKTNAEQSAMTLSAAQETLGGQQRAVESTLTNLHSLITALRGQGERLDGIDEKLGKAFDSYQEQVATSVETLFDHVKTMQSALMPALDTMQSIVDQAENFAPNQGRWS
jgi:ABC-type transporter Mla subunit MlaD